MWLSLFTESIFVGDLNCSFHANEIWGDRGRVDPLYDDIRGIIMEDGLCDIPLAENYPTWFNDRKGKDFIGKCIDRLVINNCLTSKMDGVFSIAEDITISNCRPICLLGEFKKRQGGYPFKFNRI